MKQVIKKLGIALLILLGIVILALVGLIVFLTVTEFHPEDRESAAIFPAAKEADAFSGSAVTVLSWNTGYAGLDANADFFMDGGTSVRPTDEYYVNVNLNAMICRIGEIGADFNLLQEVDQDAAKTYHIDQMAKYREDTGMSSAHAINYDCPFVPIPFPPLGKVTAGLQTLTPYEITDAERISLPCPFRWPVSAANLKRCLLVTRTPIEGSDRELVLINLHLEAYDDGEGKIAQTKVLLSVLEEEYARGNYVIAGGDFNQAFPGSLEQYPIQEPELWMPGLLEESMLPEGWHFAWDASVPTCRLLNEPYNKETTQHYVIDGFIVSPNVRITAVQTLDEAFFNTDHNPVLLEAELLDS